MSHDPDPPRKFYELKPREFERVNPPAREAQVPSSPRTAAASADPHQRIDVRELIRQGTARGPAQSVNAPANRENEIHAILRENLARANAAGLNEVAPPTHVFRRRKRDFMVLLVSGNLFIAVIYAAELFVGFQVHCLAAQMPGEFGNLMRYALHNPAAWAMAPVGMVFFSGCLTWLMYGIMENY